MKEIDSFSYDLSNECNKEYEDISDSLYASGMGKPSFASYHRVDII